MSIAEIFLIGVGLSMDAFAVAVCKGLNQKKFNIKNGFIIALIANIPNILIAVLVLIGHIFGSADGAFGYEWAGTLYVASKSVGVIWESMFSGFVQLYSPHNPVIFFLMLIPPLLASSVGYIFGMKNFRILSLIGINPKPKKK